MCAVPLSFTVELQHCHTAVLLTVLEWAIADSSYSLQWSASVEKALYSRITIPEPAVITPLWNFCYRYTRLNNLRQKSFKVQFPNTLVVFTGMW